MGEILFFVCLFLKHISKMYVCICIIHASFLHNDMCMWCFYFFSSNKMVSYHTKMYFISQFTTLILSILQKKYVISPTKNTKIYDIKPISFFRNLYTKVQNYYYHAYMVIRPSLHVLFFSFFYL